MSNNIIRKERVPRVGDVYVMNFSGVDSEQSGCRPGIVFQNNVGNTNSPNIIALPMTSSIKKIHMPTHVLLKAKDAGLKRDSVVICENPERMSKQRLVKYITTLSDEQMKKIAEASLIATSAISFLDKDELLKIWGIATKLNACRS